MQRAFNRRRFLLWGLSVLLLSLSIFIVWRAPAPLMWKGKPASYWLARLSYFDLQDGSSAEEFLFAAGPAVVPELIRGLSLPDSLLHDRWVDLYFKLGKWQQYFRMPTKRAHYRQHCARGLGLLGQAAAQAVPALLRALNDNDPYVSLHAAEALGRIGAEKARFVPKLIAGLVSTNSDHRLACVIGLTHSLPNPEAASALRKLVSDPDANLRIWVAESLWRDESDPEATFAALVSALNDGSATVRDRAAQSLGNLRYKQEAAAKALLAGLEAESSAGGNEIVNWKIITALGELGVAARLAVPLLTKLAGQTNTSGTLSVIALGRIELQNATWTDQLVKRLDASDAFLAAWELGKYGDRARGAVARLRQIAETTDSWQTKVMAATAAWRLDPSSPNPLKWIADELPQQQNGYYEVIRLLGELDPAAKIAVPALQKMRYSHGIMAHDYANDALQKIAPEFVSDPWRK
ncbi:MAG: HEAT repeat domain-containing protein [Verrucomicrobia bacterium]|nr:HEAT repeat domain-containing protein [Verrucomicrobiota bacterium]